MSLVGFMLTSSVLNCAVPGPSQVEAAGGQWPSSYRGPGGAKKIEKKHPPDLGVYKVPATFLYKVPILGGTL